MQFKKTSRKDDLISLSYLIMFLLNSFELPGFPEEFYEYDQHTGEDLFEYLQKMKQYKQTMDPKSMLKKLAGFFPGKEFTPTQKDNIKLAERKIKEYLYKFVSRVNGLKFEEEPNYPKLHRLLQQCYQVCVDFKDADDGKKVIRWNGVSETSTQDDI